MTTTFLTVFHFTFYVLTFIQLVSSNSIEISALGRVAQLGEFYDARNDQFLRLNLFQNIVPNSSIISTRNHQTSLKYTLENTYEEQFKVLDISAEQQLSILGGLIAFKDTKSSAKSAKTTLVRSFSTIYEQVSILDAALQPSINFRILPQIDATHVVVGVQRGGHVFLVLEDENQRNDDIQKVRDNLGQLAAKIAACDIHNAETQKSNLTHLNYEIYGDLVPENAPQTIFNALKFMETSQHLLEGNNDEGKAVKYVLLPLNNLKKLWNIKTDLMVNRIDASTVKNCVRLFDTFKITHQELEDVASDVDKFKNHLVPEKLNKMHILKMTVEMFHSEVTADLSKLTIKVRSGKENVSVLRNWCRKREGFVREWQKSTGTFLREMKQEISFLELLQRDGVILFNKQQNFNQLLYQNYGKDLYVFFYTYDNNTWFESLNNLKKLIHKKTSSQNIYIAVNNELVASGNSCKTNRISVYRNGILITDNYPEINSNNPNSETDLWSMNEIQSRITDLEKKSLVPINFIYVQFPYQQTPEELWPGTKWKNVSAQYAGLFFRAEGGPASAFESVQESTFPRNYLTQYENKALPEGNPSPDKCFAKACSMNPNGWSDWIYTGKFHHDGYNPKRDSVYVRFGAVTVDDEVRPRNLAIRIWQRIR